MVRLRSHWPPKVQEQGGGQDVVKLGDLGAKKGNPNQLLKRWRSVSQYILKLYSRLVNMFDSHYSHYMVISHGLRAYLWGKG